jgi:hypothetical protein
MRRVGAFVMLLALAAMPLAAQETGTTTLHGYVVDQHCAGTLAGKTNAMEKAAGHSKDCALMESCAASGYGIFSEGKYYKFDAKGSRRAQELFEKSKLSKGMYFTATGKLAGETLTLASLTEAKPPKMAKESAHPH